MEIMAFLRNVCERTVRVRKIITHSFNLTFMSHGLKLWQKKNKTPKKQFNKSYYKKSAVESKITVGLHNNFFKKNQQKKVGRT
jgi:hypothetical protein